MADFVNFLSGNYAHIIFICLIGYLLGSVNISIILTKALGMTDIRKMGSGNAGFTNVLRTVGIKQAIVTFIGDFLKAVIAIAVAWLIMSTATDKNEYIVLSRYICGLFCVIGHMFPIYFGFRGGKGVVTSAAVILMCDWKVFLIVLSVFLVVFMFSKIISLSSLSAAVGFFVASFCVNYFALYLNNNCSFMFVVTSTVMSFLIALLVIVKHKDNIIRLKNGQEKKITPKKKDS